jgi:hypothetical protein
MFEEIKVQVDAAHLIAHFWIIPVMPAVSAEIWLLASAHMPADAIAKWALQERAMLCNQPQPAK